MQFRVRPMDEAAAEAIAGWHYEGSYAFYDMDQDAEDLAELLDPEAWTDRYYAVKDEAEALVGFFCFEKEEGTVILGLGLRPDLTGGGLGAGFVEAGLDFAREKYAPATFRLSVATFNRRAIAVYRKVGFKDEALFTNETNGGQYEFLSMTRPAQLPGGKG